MKRLMIPALALVVALATAAPASAADYDIDNGHSMALFRVKHLGVGFFWGVFHHVTGSVSWDAAAPAKSSIKISVKADSVFTADKKRDGHLKAPDFFAAKEHPNMTFESTSVKGNGKTLDVVGNMTIRGKTKSVTAKVEFGGEGVDPWGNTRAGFEARLTIKRSEFGVAYMPGGLGEDVQLIIAIESIKKK